MYAFLTVIDAELFLATVLVVVAVIAICYIIRLTIKVSSKSNNMGFMLMLFGVLIVGIILCTLIVGDF